MRHPGGEEGRAAEVRLLRLLHLDGHVPLLPIPHDPHVHRAGIAVAEDAADVTGTVDLLARHREDHVARAQAGPGCRRLGPDVRDQGAVAVLDAEVLAELLAQARHRNAQPRPSHPEGPGPDRAAVAVGHRAVPEAHLGRGPEAQASVQAGRLLELGADLPLGPIADHPQPDGPARRGLPHETRERGRALDRLVVPAHDHVVGAKARLGGGRLVDHLHHQGPPLLGQVQALDLLLVHIRDPHAQVAAGAGPDQHAAGGGPHDARAALLALPWFPFLLLDQPRGGKGESRPRQRHHDP